MRFMKIVMLMMMMSIGSLTVLATDASGAAASTAAAPLVRRYSFDFGWKFRLGDEAGFEQLGMDDSHWQAVDLPHDWSIAGAFDQQNPAGGGGGYLPTGMGWYRKTFVAPDAFAGKHVSVEFDGVYECSEVWLNGKSLGKRPFGYIGFSYDLTPLLKFGGAQNVLAVRVDNSRQPNSRWYSGSGIYRHTWLNVTDPLRIAPHGVWVTTPVVKDDVAAVEIAVDLINGRPTPAGADANGRVRVVSMLVDPAGATAGQAMSQSELDAGEAARVTQQIRVANPQLWSDTSPVLYSLTTRVFVGDEAVDERTTPIGIRTIEFDVDRGFLLNGKPVKLNGVCLHGDGGCVGAAVPEAIWLRRLKLLKQMGCNAIRTSHNPPAPEFLDLCDRLGFLVMDEAFDEWEAGKTPGGYHRFFDEWWHRDLVDFIHRDRNHPCVVLWSAGNEIQEQVLTGGAEVLQPLVETFHREDPTRMVTAACDKIFAEPVSAPPEFAALLDVVGYNYVDRWLDRSQSYYGVDRALYPKRRFIGTESVSTGSIRGDYSGLFHAPAATEPAPPPIEVNQPPTGQGQTNPATAARAGADRRRFRPVPLVNRQIDVEQLWKFVGSHDYVGGDFMWTGIDYLGEAFWPSRSASFGVIDTCGFPKDGFYFYQSQWTRQPMLHLFPHWNWKGHEGEVIPVTCYTNCDTVELLVNGKSFGSKGYEFPRRGMSEDYGHYPPRAYEVRTTSDLHLTWDVPYAPGVLEAVGRVNGHVVARQKVVTTGQAAAIELTCEEASLADDRRDVGQVAARIVDVDGNTVPDADSEITFSVEGPARLIGTDNGNPQDHTAFGSSVRRAFNGLCLAVVRSGGGMGSIKLTARSEGLKSAELVLATRKAAPEAVFP
jgi:beta-galactosidase